MVGASTVALRHPLQFLARCSGSQDMADVLSGLQFVKGEPISLASGHGTTVFVLEFWATWCPPCRSSIPHVSSLQQKYKDQNVVFIGVTNEEAPQITKFVQNMGNQMDYRVAIDSEGRVNEAYMGKNGIKSIPHAFVIGKDGQVVWHGHPMDAELETSVQNAVKVSTKPPVNIASLSKEELLAMRVIELREILANRHINYSDCVEKIDLVERILEKCK